MGSLVQAQWSLNETSDSVIGIARGVLQAATSDNVQPLAIIACEQFGNTLAISRETRLRIERNVLPTPEPVAIRFLKAKVGFAKYDCAVQLGSNQAGLRFLALAAALIPSVSVYGSAEALMLMLEATTSDRRLLPTTRHLADLMSSLEARCRFSGFADIYFGYNSIISGASRSKGYKCYDGARFVVPEHTGLAALVDACRQLQRVGEDEIDSVIVETRDCAAWVAAFAKWSLELPPSIYFADGTPIVPQPGSQFTLVVHAEADEPENEIRIIKRYKLDSIQDLVVQSSSKPASPYCIQFRTYCDLLSDHCGNQKWVRDAIFAALPLAITRVCERLEPNRILAPSLENESNEAQGFTINLPGYFPTNKVLFRTMRLVFNLDSDFPFDSLASATSYEDLPEVEHYFHKTEHCSKVEDAPFHWSRELPREVKPGEEPTRSYLVGPNSNAYSQYAFIGKVGIICYSLLLLSMFDNMEDLHFVPETPPQGGNIIYKRIRYILTTGGDPVSLRLGDILVEMFKLVKSQSEPVSDHIEVLVSSTKTHVFWISTLDYFRPRSTGILSISSCRGRIRHDGETYDNVKKDKIYRSHPSASELESGFTYPKLQWKLGVSVGSISANLSLINHREPRNVYGYIDPIATIELLESSSVLVNCKHLVEKPSELKELLSKEYPALHIFPMGGIGEVQMFGLGQIAERIVRQIFRMGGFSQGATKEPAPRVVIQQGACFACCIKACERVGATHLLL
ncbi:hypothetical protein F4679DRAFT_94532 [Xylaria curta]|nr:hypothetical protein F4679DRAFT_94532 [Xylaria curta]